MAKPKGKLFALLAVFAAIGLVTATGAFTTVQAERTAEIGVAGDSSALLQLQGSGTANAQEYVTTNNGQLGLDLQNVNLDAETDINDTFTITNQGSQTVGVWITRADTQDNNGDDDLADTVAFYNPDGHGGTQLGGNDVTPSSSGTAVPRTITDESNAVNLDPGESLTVSIYINVGDVGTQEDLIDTVTVHADADVDGNAGPDSS